MSARPPGGISGLPSKPVGANMPGPAPPLPAGPPPAQPSYPHQQDAQAAHAAAWAAYYQAQGQAGYAAAPGATPGATPTANNPYANYGYSAAASAQHSAHIQTPYPGQAPAAAPYRPPTQPYQSTPYSGPQQPQANYAQGYQYPQQYGQAGQPGYQWPAQPAQAQPQAGPNQPYRPPQQGYQTPNQPFYPQQQAFSPVRPSPSPGPTAGPNRPYQPQPLNRAPSGPTHPHMRPMGAPGASPTAFPPAKRPRFDGPGGMSGPGAPAGPAGNMQPRPPGNVRPPPTAMTNNAQQGFNARPPSHPSLPSAPTAPSAAGIPAKPVGPAGAPSGPSGARSNPPLITRPPIHLGFNTPTPTPVPIATPFGVPMRGSFAGRGMRGGARGGAVLNAPRGPAGMRRQDQVTGRKEVDRKRREKEKDRYREREERITMTDFRIVGIEVKGLDWTWGLIGGEQPEDKQKEEEKAKMEKGDEESESKTEAAETTANGDAAEPTAGAEVKDEEEQVTSSEETKVEDHAETDSEEKEPVPSEQPVKSEPVETVEEKRGEKRKAKSPDISEGSSPKKRSGEYLLTHGKPNESASLTTSSSAVSDSSQNRFRIYFESPAELDRVPKALRRNPNKRWRRASSSVAPSVAGARAGREDTVATVDEAVEPTAEVPTETLAVAAEADQAVLVEEVNGEQPGAAAAVGAIAEAPQESAEDAVEDVTETSLAVPTDNTDTTTQGATDPVNGEQHDAVNGDSTAPADASAQDPAEPATAIPGESHDEIAVTGTLEAEDEEIGDVSMRTDGGDLAGLVSGEVDAAPSVEATEASAEAAAEPTANGHADKADSANANEAPTSAPATASANAPSAQSADNAAAAYKSRTRRRSSVSSAGSADDAVIDPSIPTPSTNRVSILYEGSSRRICVDADLVSKVRIHRAEGRIEVVLNAFTREGESKDLPKGVLIETYDPVDQRFVPATSERLEELWAEQSDATVPPFQREPTQEQMVITVWLNLVRPLSEPKWCRGNSADEWLIEQFGARKAATDGGWRGKLEVVDPDPAPTLPEILRSWVTSSSVGSESDRESFTKTLSADPNDLLEILLRLTRGDRIPAASSGGSLGPLATAIRADSPFASHQTHVSLAILAMYRLTTDYAKKAGESSEVVNEKISDIIKSLPVGMISRSLDGLFREWAAR